MRISDWSSDVCSSDLLGITIQVGHRAENIGEASVVVVSSAIKPDNPELTAARALMIPIVRRAEMLGEPMRLKWSIAVGGTHGTTRTTSMIAAILDAAGLAPTVIYGDRKSTRVHYSPYCAARMQSSA